MARRKPRDARIAQLRIGLYLAWTAVVWITWLSLDHWEEALRLVWIVPHHLSLPWPHFGDAVHSAVKAVLSVVLIAAAAAAAGGAALRFVRLRSGIPLSFALGLSLLALVTQALGLAGLLFTDMLLWAVVGGGLAAARSLLRPRGALPLLSRLPGLVRMKECPASLRWPIRAAVVMVGLAALAPEVAWDAAVYHLRAPTLHLLEHKVHPLPAIPHSFFPFSGEMVLMLAKNLGGDPAARMLHALVWFGCGIGVARLAARSGAAARPWALSLFLTLPIGLVLATRAYIEFFMVLPCVLAAGLLAGRSVPGAAAVAAAGWLAGSAFGAKYQGGFAALVIAGFAVHRARPRMGAAAIFAFAALAPAAPWLVRNFLWTGNPVFPAVFGGIHWTALDARGLAADAMATQPLLRSLAVALRDLLGGLSNDGGYSPMLLSAAAAPLLWAGARRAPLWTMAAALFVIWLATAPHPRFLVVGAAFASAGAAGVMNGTGLVGRLGAAWLSRLAVAGMWMSLVLGFGAIYHTSEPYPAAIGKWSPREYRERRLSPPGYVRTLEVLESEAAPGRRAYVLGHVFAHDLPRRVWFDYIYLRPPLYWWLRGAGSHQRVLVRARQANLTHIAYNPFGAWTINAGNPDLLPWEPEELRAYLGFWLRNVEYVTGVEGWRIYRIVPDRPPGAPPPGVPPGTEGITAAIDRELASRRPDEALRLARAALKRYPFFACLKERLERAEREAAARRR